MRLLLSRGADIDQFTDNGYTALMTAADNGRVEVVQALLEHKANVNMTSAGGFTALYFAAQSAYSASAKLQRVMTG